jgi:hypothetical protein
MSGAKNILKTLNGEFKVKVKRDRQMSDEIEKKVPVETEEKAESTPATGMNALELLSGAASTGAAAGAAAGAAGEKIGKDFGKLEITDEKNGIGKLRDLLNNGERIEGALDRLGNKLEPKELPLSRTENLMLNGMRDAIRSGSVEKVQEMLQALAENPKSVDRVMRELNKQLKDQDPLNSASWETGKDSNGNSFVRLRLNHTNDWSKSSGSTEVTIGSDGRHSANYTKRWDSTPVPVNPADNMYHFNPKWQHIPQFERETYKKSGT